MVEELGAGLSRALSLYAELGMQSFNMALYGAPPTLPGYMLPGTVVVLERMPLTPNGKLDRAALPEPPRAAPPPATAAAPGATAAAVAEIWCDVLGLPDIGPDENLFDLGGHSLVIMQIMARIRQRLGVEVPMDAFFVTPTVAGIASAIDAEVDR